MSSISKARSNQVLTCPYLSCAKDRKPSDLSQGHFLIFPPTFLSFLFFFGVFSKAAGVHHIHPHTSTYIHRHGYDLAFRVFLPFVFPFVAFPAQYRRHHPPDFFFFLQGCQRNYDYTNIHGGVWFWSRWSFLENQRAKHVVFDSIWWRGVIAYWHSKYLQHPIYPVLIRYTKFCFDSPPFR